MCACVCVCVHVPSVCVSYPVIYIGACVTPMASLAAVRAPSPMRRVSSLFSDCDLYTSFRFVCLAGCPPSLWFPCFVAVVRCVLFSAAEVLVVVLLLLVCRRLPP
eukprot:EC814360.1.p3 GENE.EC814360.1~~EC814360.1.p3  ORF type:complete len:105 (-),score=3.21 EC814360.1:197-511(-)